MPIENASYIADLDPDQPQGNESISEGDDHLRVIKYALTKSFPNVDGVVDWTPQDFTDVKEAAARAPDSNGIFAGCKWDGSNVTYGHNVSSVDWSGGKRNTVYFSKPTDGFDNHYAVQVTPIASNARPVIAFVTDQRDSWVSVDIWEFDGTTWGTPVGPVGFYMTMIDMIQTEANSNT